MRKESGRYGCTPVSRSCHRCLALRPAVDELQRLTTLRISRRRLSNNRADILSDQILVPPHPPHPTLLYNTSLLSSTGLVIRMRLVVGELSLCISTARDIRFQKVMTSIGNMWFSHLRPTAAIFARFPSVDQVFPSSPSRQYQCIRFDICTWILHPYFLKENLCPKFCCPLLYCPLRAIRYERILCIIRRNSSSN